MRLAQCLDRRHRAAAPRRASRAPGIAASRRETIWQRAACAARIRGRSSSVGKTSAPSHAIPASTKRAEPIELERERRDDARSRRADAFQRGNSVRRDLADERDRQVDVFRPRGAPAGAGHDISGNRGDALACRRVRPQREEHAQRRGIRRAGFPGRPFAPRRHADSVDATKKNRAALASGAVCRESAVAFSRWRPATRPSVFRRTARPRSSS